MNLWSIIDRIQRSIQVILMMMVTHANIRHVCEDHIDLFFLYIHRESLERLQNQTEIYLKKIFIDTNRSQSRKVCDLFITINKCDTVCTNLIE